MDYKTAEKRSHLMYEKILKRGYSEDEMSDILDYSSFEYHRGFAHAYNSKPQLTDYEMRIVERAKSELKNTSVQLNYHTLKGYTELLINIIETKL